MYEYRKQLYFCIFSHHDSFYYSSVTELIAFLHRFSWGECTLFENSILSIEHHTDIDTDTGDHPDSCPEYKLGVWYLPVLPWHLGVSIMSMVKLS